jgi:hypothetical protein
VTEEPDQTIIVAGDKEATLAFAAYRASQQAHIFELRQKVRAAREATLFWRCMTIGSVLIAIITHIIRRGW